MVPKVQILGENNHKNSSQILTDLRNENFLTDVTLVTEDFSFLPAHQIILTAMSGYFEQLFRLKVTTKQTLVCLQSVSYLELTQIIQYIYQGEIEIDEDKLDRFLELAERFGLKGLSIERQSLNDSKELLLEGRKVNEKEKIQGNDIETLERAIKKENLALTFNQSLKQNRFLNCSLPYSKNKNLIAFVAGREVSMEEIDEMILPLYKKNENKDYVCLKCPMVAKGLKHISEHVEKHIKELDYICKECGKRFAISQANRFHFYSGACNKRKLKNLNN